MKWRVIQAATRSWQPHLKWLTPGIGVKRWLIILALGVGLLSFGGALLLRVYFDPLPRLFYYLTLQYLPQGIRAGLIIAVGLWLLTYGMWGFNRAILAPFIIGRQAPIPTVLHDYRRRARGSHVVVIGGGHGQATALRGLKAFTSNLSAIVTVADDGGSSGRLRRETGILPPGDFRNCIAALANDESLVTRLFQYRYAQGKELQGHSFGNLFISAMAGITGSFEGALTASSQVLAVQGQVLPSTLEAVTLCADIGTDGKTAVRVRGESRIAATHGDILRVMLEPSSPSAYPGAIRAILAADLIVIGPGSLYTSILPNLLVPRILEALRATSALKVYVCNVATQPGETDGYTAQAHLSALERHIGEEIIDAMVVNTRLPRNAPIMQETECEWVKPEMDAADRPRIVEADLIHQECNGQHDSHRLAQVLLELLE
jgi:uncharacterized cofD-like protein